MSGPLRTVIERPVSALAVALLVVLFGVLALFRLPVQLTPTVEPPRITVTTQWPGASPLEVEREIVLRQEEQLEGISGLLRLESTSDDGVGTLELTFRLETELESALVLVANRLQQVRDHPEDAERPIVESVGTDRNNIAWFMLQPSEDRTFAGDVTELGDLAENLIEPRLESVAGVARATIAGARSARLEVRVDAAKLAARQLTFGDLAAAVENGSRDWSAGDIERGAGRLVVRTVNAFRSTDDVLALPVAERDGVTIRVSDVATVGIGHEEAREVGFYLGRPAVGINVQKQAGANVLRVMQDVRAVVDQLNADVLAPRGLKLNQSYDETEYIDRAVSLVRQSLVIGGLLAISVLFLFLRSWSATVLVAATIPVSLLGACLVLLMVGSTLNVLTLAGLAFAVGMVVDNGIVVLENIVRHRQSGASRRRAAYRGVKEVWGAVLASTVTTLAVFLPIIAVRGEMGQMFRDLAVAIAAAVAFSLLVSVIVVPGVAAKLLDVPRDVRSFGQSRFDRSTRLDQWAVRFGEALSHAVYRLCGGTRRRLSLVVGMTLVAVLGSLLLKPETDYLPAGNRNFLYCLFQPDAGSNLAQVVTFQEPFISRLSRWSSTAQRGGGAEYPGGGVRSVFFVAGPTFGVLGVRARDPARVQELMPELEAAAAEVEGSRTLVLQRSVFEDSLVRGRNIDLDVSGPDLDRLWTAAQEALGRVEAALPGAAAQLVPSPGQVTPEIRVDPKNRRLSELGLVGEDVALAMGALIDGQRVGIYLHEGREMDIVMTAGAQGNPPELGSTPLATPLGHVVTLGSVVSLSEGLSPASVRRLGRQRTVTVQVQPPPDMALETSVAKLKSEVVSPMSGELLEAGVTAQVSGSASELVEAGRAMFWVLLLAVALVYLLMAALFESFLLPLVILWTVPLAALGGFLGLRVLGLFVPQRLDVLTMLGFVVLIGTVVNNAILLVHQALQHRRRDDMGHRDAVVAAARNRIRPIFMSALTSIFGMLPLVLFPGAGAELYRGLGSVVIGGLAVSTVLTLLVAPALLSLVLEGRKALRSRLRPRLRFLEDSSRLNISPPNRESGSGVIAVDRGQRYDW